MSIATNLMMAAHSGTIPKENEARCVVRLTTNCFISGGRATFSKVVSRLKRKSQLDFEEISFDDCNDDLDFSHIVNLMEVEDGIYYLDPHETDWDSDEYGCNSYWYATSWKLVPYEE